MEVNAEEVKGWVSIIVAGAGSVFGVGKLYQSLRDRGLRLQAVEKAVAAIPEDIKRRLYDEKSQPIYQPVLTCAKCREDCERNRAKEYKALKDSIDLLIKIHMEKGEGKGNG